MEYESFNYTNKQEIESLLATGSNDTIKRAIIGAVNGIDDRQWLEDICLRYVSHPDYWAAKTAINSLGDIGRIYQEVSQKVISALKDLNNDSLKGTVKEALGDITMFAKSVIKHKYTVRQQFLNNSGRYAIIDFETSIDKNKQSNIIVNYNADTRWEIACRAGIVLFYDYSLLNCELSVTINEIIWRPVDTNNLTVIYATLQGLAEAYGIEIASLEIDVVNESFVFPT